MPLSKPLTHAEWKKIRKEITAEDKKLQTQIDRLPEVMKAMIENKVQKQDLYDGYSRKSHTHPEVEHTHTELEDLAQEKHNHTDLVCKLMYFDKMKEINKLLKERENQSTITLGKGLLYLVSLVFIFMGAMGVSIHWAYGVIGVILFIMASSLKVSISSKNEDQSNNEEVNENI